MFSYLDLWDKARRIIRLKSFNQRFHERVDYCLRKQLAPVIKEYTNHTSVARFNAVDDIDMQSSSIVWVMWWQGIETAPEVVRACYKQLNVKFSSVTLIDKNNVHELVDFDATIWSKFENGTIELTFLSDYIRFKVLERFGGLWVDATVFLGNFDQNLLKTYPLYTPKGIDYARGKYVPRGRWRGYFLQIPQHAVVARFVIDSFERYWRHNDKLLNFFLIDYVLNIAYDENIGGFHDLVDSLPDDGGPVFELDKVLIRGDMDLIRRAILVPVSKLSWKHHYSSVAPLTENQLIVNNSERP